MKYYKVTDSQFCGFYDRDIHGDIVDGEEYIEIEEDKWQELLNGQSEGKEIRILKDGTLGLYEFPPLEEVMLNPTFNYDTEQWEEKATEEEILNELETKLVEVQKDIKLREELGLRPTKEQLELKETLIARHLNVCHEIALTLN